MLRFLLLLSALLQVASNEGGFWTRFDNGCTECGHRAQVQMMSIEIGHKSCNECETREAQSYKNKLKKQSSLSQDFRESKKGT